VKFIDYYKVLGVSESVNDGDLKKAYRRLARKYHPDVSKEKDAEEKIKSINEAYEVLKDKDRRAEYDQLRKYGGEGGQDFRPPPGWQNNSGFSRGRSQGDFSDFFETMFGDGRGGFGSQRSRPENVTYNISVSLEESYHGAQRRMNLTESNGSVRSLDVNIPKGILNGQKIRLRGQGPAGRGGSGDVLLQVTLKPHKHFRLEGRDVFLIVPISPWEAALGVKTSVPTLSGAVNLNIPAGTNNGKKMRLKGKGLPGSTNGDQYVELQLTMPSELSQEALDLLRQLGETTSFDPRESLSV